jgi:hypothetical protein
MEPKWIEPIIYSGGGILLAAAAIRFVIAAGESPLMAMPEPMLGIPLRYAVLTVGGLELLIALICLFGRQIAFQVACLAWLSTDFIVYRIGLLLTHSHPQTTCIGSLTDPLHLASGAMGLLVALMPFCLLVGSYVAFTCLWDSWAALPRSLPSDVIMSCPGCGVHIRFAGENLGRQVLCPQCLATITLRKPDLLKTACSHCRQHIEFSAHALGQTICCPHCKREITLNETA